MGNDDMNYKDIEKNDEDEYYIRVNKFNDSLIVTDSVAPKWSLDDFDIACKIGEGQFGAVYLARERRTGFIVAIKAIKKAQLLKTSNEHLLRREIEIHSHLIHPNILGFYSWFTTPNLICLVIEIAPKGELMDQLSDGGLKEPIASKYMFQMISAIRTCHRINVIHRDLKPENILLDQNGSLKLADFGWAAHIPEEISNKNNNSKNTKSNNKENALESYDYLKNRRKTYCGTLDYLSPEIVRHEWYGKEVDLWCLGILCYELVVGGPPFPHVNYRNKGLTEDEARKRQQEDIQKIDIESRLYSWMSEELKDFLKKTLDKNPTNRINADQMLRHPFILKHNAENVEKELKIDKLLQNKEAQIITPSNRISQELPPDSWNYSRIYISSQRTNT